MTDTPTDPQDALLPCPFCGEKLVEQGDHHGQWIGHKEIGGCFIGVSQLFDDTDYKQWNTRHTTQDEETIAMRIGYIISKNFDCNDLSARQMDDIVVDIMDAFNPVQDAEAALIKPSRTEGAHPSTGASTTQTDANILTDANISNVSVVKNVSYQNTTQDGGGVNEAFKFLYGEADEYGDSNLGIKYIKALDTILAALKQPDEGVWKAREAELLAVIERMNMLVAKAALNIIINPSEAITDTVWMYDGSCTMYEHLISELDIDFEGLPDDANQLREFIEKHAATGRLKY